MAVAASSLNDPGAAARWMNLAAEQSDLRQAAAAARAAADLMDAKAAAMAAMVAATGAAAAADASAGSIGLPESVLVTVMRFTDVATIACATAACRELRTAYHACQVDVVRNLLFRRSHRMQQLVGAMEAEYIRRHEIYGAKLEYGALVALLKQHQPLEEERTG